METFTGTVITTALPAMAKSFGSDPVRLSLGITGYMLSLAIFIPLSGWIADRHGARTIFRAAIGIFTIASVFCGLSNDLLQLVAARVIQGIGGAMMVPVGRLVLLRSVERSDYVRAMSYVVVPAFMGPVLGPPIGGFITTYLSWRWVFYLNVPIGVVGMVLVTLLIKNQREPQTPPLDWRGFILSGVSLACILYSLDLAAHGNTDATIACLGLLVAGVGIGVFAVAHARRHPFPLIDLSLFRLPTFALAVGGGVIFRIAAGAIPFLLPVFLQVGLGMTAFAAGILILADSLGNIAMNAVAPATLRRFGFRVILVYNGVLSAGAVAGPALIGVTTPDAVICVGFLLAGLLRSLQYNALSTLQYAEIPARDMSAATSLASMVQQLCNGAGIAVGAVLLQLALMSRGASAGAISARDVRVVLVAAGCLALGSLLFFRRLAPDAGAELSGHGAVAKPAPRSAD